MLEFLDGIEIFTERSGEKRPYENTKGQVALLGIVFKFFGIAFGVVLFLYLIANILRSSRRLDKKIAAFKEEQEENAKQGKILNPYAALSELYTDSATQENTEPRRKRRR